MSERRLIDGFGRVHNNLRISVTDRCNIRCFYCMPAEDVVFMERASLLTFEEIERTVRVGVQLGINKLRITGGEPLVRRDLHVLLKKLIAIDGINDVGMTTNGVLLADQANQLRDAGLTRLNISLDALEADKFKQVTRRDVFDKVIEGVNTARDSGFRIKINAVAIKGLTEDQIVPFGRFARETGAEVRFIEFMPLDADNAWQKKDVLSGKEIIDTLAEGIGPIHAIPPEDDRAPASEFQFADGVGKIGIIASVTQPFCGSCNRFRLTSDGKLRNCLFATAETDIRDLLRGDGTDDEIANAMLSSIAAKKAGHEITNAGFVQPDRPMYSIGG